MAARRRPGRPLPYPLVSFRPRKRILSLSFISLFETATTATTRTATTAQTTRSRGKIRNNDEMRAMICDERESNNDTKRERDCCMYLPRRSPFISLTNPRALLSELKWMRISKTAICDMGERASERAKKFSNVDNHRKRPTPEHAEARQLFLRWAGCRKRCQRRTGNRLQSTSTPNETRDGIGREEIPQSNVVATSGALIGREKRGISSASAERIPQSSVVSTSASFIGATLCTRATIVAAAAA